MHTQQWTRAWPSDNELIELVREAQHDTPGALDRLLVRLRSSFLDFFSRRIPADAAEDVAQAALIRVARALGRIEPERAPHFVATLALNRLRSERARRAREERRLVPLSLAADVEAPDNEVEEVEDRDLAAAVRRASLTVLPAPLADIVLAVLRGLRHSEIAAQQAISPVTVRTRLLRARTLLRAELGLRERSR
jgi:RNA polymerase sigma factor (sigma-70 family)